MGFPVQWVALRSSAQLTEKLAENLKIGMEWFIKMVNSHSQRWPPPTRQAKSFSGTVKMLQKSGFCSPVLEKKSGKLKPVEAQVYSLTCHDFFTVF